MRCRAQYSREVKNVGLGLNSKELFASNSNVNGYTVYVHTLFRNLSGGYRYEVVGVVIAISWSPDSVIDRRRT